MNEDVVFSRKRLGVSPFTSLQKSLRYASSALQTQTPETEDGVDLTITSPFLCSDWIFALDSGKTFTSSPLQQLWIEASDVLHCSLTKLSISIDLLLLASGTAENQTHTIGVSA